MLFDILCFYQVLHIYINKKQRRYMDARNCRHPPKRECGVEREDTDASDQVSDVLAYSFVKVTYGWRKRSPDRRRRIFLFI